ncbi:hypothetical protein [Sphingomonas sp. R1]|uniref:hypothetical protein n=1 Tax=Sphingomonas sp. R1 TaxID=399176 RepID=UPI00222596D4|nr:hypothetical protein [Sphingomonas sp. R1]UYY78390.1 hypothetical protein OIM94_05140 [Sphingomonas sp. R1]
MDAIERTNWLAHRWQIELESFPYGEWLIHVGKVEGHRVVQTASAAEFEAWKAAQRPLCLARFIAERRELHPAEVVIFAGTHRLGRIPPELWCGYDVTLLIDEPPATLLSAKVRAMFPPWPGALVRVLPQAEVPTLGLRKAEKVSGPRLRLVS